MDQIHDRVAGLDVHRDSVTACVRFPGPRRGTLTRKEQFATTTAGLGCLREWLGSADVSLVALEATGVYWKPVVRHEALFDREGMKGPLLWAVAAAR
jgi:transposase